MVTALPTNIIKVLEAWGITKIVSAHLCVYTYHRTSPKANDKSETLQVSCQLCQCSKFKDLFSIILFYKTHNQMASNYLVYKVITARTDKNLYGNWYR
jgi:hypothetical protein